MNWPAPDSAVTSTIAISTGCVKTSFHARRFSAAGRTPSGNTDHTHSGAARGQQRDQRERKAPAEGFADEAVQRHAEHRSDRPAEKDERDRAAALLWRRERTDHRSRLRREHGGAEHAQRAHRCEQRVTRHQRRQRMSKRVPDKREGKQPAPIPAADRSGQQRGAESHHHRGHRDELTAERDAHLQRARQVIERAGHDHHAAADREVAEQQRPAHPAEALGTVCGSDRGAGHRIVQRST